MQRILGYKGIVHLVIDWLCAGHLGIFNCIRTGNQPTSICPGW